MLLMLPHRAIQAQPTCPDVSLGLRPIAQHVLYVMLGQQQGLHICACHHIGLPHTKVALQQADLADELAWPAQGDDAVGGAAAQGQDFICGCRLASEVTLLLWMLRKAHQAIKCAHCCTGPRACQGKGGWQPHEAKCCNGDIHLLGKSQQTSLNRSRGWLAPAHQHPHGLHLSAMVQIT